MSIFAQSDLKLTAVQADGVVGASKANVLGPEQGWHGHTLRLFRLEANGHTPHHQHPWEHVNYITKGAGTLTIAGETRVVTQGDFALVPPDTMHQFANPNGEPFEFICIVPQRGAY